MRNWYFGRLLIQKRHVRARHRNLVGDQRGDSEDHEELSCLPHVEWDFSTRK